MKYLMCGNQPKGCVWAVAQVYDDNTVDIVRKKNRFTINGEQYNVLATCPRCHEFVTMTIKDGKLDEEDLILFNKEEYDGAVKEAIEKRKQEREDNSGEDTSGRDTDGGVEEGGGEPDDSEKGVRTPTGERQFTAKAK